MEIKPINTEADYHAVLSEIEKLMMAEADTPEGDCLAVLVASIEAYESKHYALDLHGPIAQEQYPGLTEEQEHTLNRRIDSYHANPSLGRTWGEIITEFWSVK